MTDAVLILQAREKGEDCFHMAGCFDNEEAMKEQKRRIQERFYDDPSEVTFRHSWREIHSEPEMGAPE